MKTEKPLAFKGIGDNDQLHYEKADVFKTCRIDDNFAISFYQLDYQAVVNALSGTSSLKPEETKLIPISKVVMNFSVFKKLIEELQVLQKKVGDENIK